MSPEITSPNASQTVERIREIIVGRHLERLEQRVARLETHGSASSSQSYLGERLMIAEAQVEALQQNVSRLTDTAREELERHHFLQRDEIQRLAHQIQQIAATRPSSGITQAVGQLEQRLGTWLTQWKSSVQQHLESRDQRIHSYLQSQIETLKAEFEMRLADIEARYPDRKQLEIRFKKIADAAAALADSVSSLPPLPLADPPPQ